MIRIPLQAASCTLLTVLALTGCRYGFTGGALPSDVKTVAVIPFENETTSSELPLELAEALREGLERRLGLRVATEDKADVVLRGKIRRYDADVPATVSADRQRSTVARRRLTIGLDIQLVNQRTGAILWQKAGMSADGEYGEGAEASGRKQAVERIVADVVEGAQSQW